VDFVFFFRGSGCIIASHLQSRLQQVKALQSAQLKKNEAQCASKGDSLLLAVDGPTWERITKCPQTGDLVMASLK
jgi:hypothetical protein